MSFLCLPSFAINLNTQTQIIKMKMTSQRRRQTRYSEDVFDTTQQQLRTAAAVVVGPSYNRPSLTLFDGAVSRSAQHATIMANMLTNDDGNEKNVVVFDLFATNQQKDEINNLVIMKKMKEEMSIETSRLILLSKKKPPLSGERGQDEEEEGRAKAVIVSSSFGAVVVRQSHSIYCDKRKESMFFFLSLE